MRGVGCVYRLLYVVCYILFVCVLIVRLYVLWCVLIMSLIIVCCIVCVNACVMCCACRLWYVACILPCRIRWLMYGVYALVWCMCYLCVLYVTCRISCVVKYGIGVGGCG